MAARADWLHRFPPFRMPGFRRTRHHHDAEVAFAAAFFTMMARLFVLELVIGVWLIEVEAWVIAWTYYGMFLGARWVWRGNVVGRAWMAVTGRRRRPVERPVPYAAPPNTIDGPTAAWLASQDPYRGMGAGARDGETGTWPQTPPEGGMQRRG